MKVRWEEIEISNEEGIDEANSGGCRYPGVLELDQIMCQEMKRKVREVYQKRITLLRQN